MFIFICYFFSSSALQCHARSLFGTWRQNLTFSLEDFTYQLILRQNIHIIQCFFFIMNVSEECVVDDIGLAE